MNEYSETPTSELFERYVAPTYGRFDLQPQRGRGAELRDESGRSYLDFGGGIAVSSLGHAHPAMGAAIKEQADQLIHCSNLYQPRGQALLAKKFSEQVVGVHGKTFFSNSGAEANEALIKLSRRFGQVRPKTDGQPRREIISFTGSFHGRTTGGMAATGQDKIRKGFGPLMEGFTHLPFNDVDTLCSSVSDDSVAILFEPVQGEGGINLASEEFISTAAEICRERDMLLLLDEVQCGLGRCGHLCGWFGLGDTHGIVPDAISWAKGLGGGYPIGAAWFKDRPAGDGRLCDLLGPGSHGSTYGGSPMASAVGSAVLDTIIKDGLAENAAALGEHILKTARGWNHSALADVRGLGLMLGFEIDTHAIESCKGFTESSRTPALYVIDRLHEAGLLTVPAGADVVRWLPPLVVTQEQVDEALTIMKSVLDSLLS